MRSDRGLTLVEILAALMGIVILVTLSLTAFGRARRQDKVERCRANLKTMFQAQDAFYKAAPALAGSARGKEFWMKLLKAQPPRLAPETVRCPLSDYAQPPPCEYRGPAKDALSLRPEEYLGCDDALNHSATGAEGGNILLKSGQVVTDSGESWRSAAFGPKCSDSGE